MVFPLAIILIGLALNIDPQTLIIAVIFGSVPTAAGAYSLAKQMGGDAPAMAAIVTVQTALSFITMPLTILLLARFLGVEI